MQDKRVIAKASKPKDLQELQKLQENPRVTTRRISALRPEKQEVITKLRATSLSNQESPKAVKETQGEQTSPLLKIKEAFLQSQHKLSPLVKAVQLADKNRKTISPPPQSTSIGKTKTSGIDNKKPEFKLMLEDNQNEEHQEIEQGEDSLSLQLQQQQEALQIKQAEKQKAEQDALQLKQVEEQKAEQEALQIKQAEKQKAEQDALQLKQAIDKLNAEKLAEKQTKLKQIFLEETLIVEQQIQAANKIKADLALQAANKLKADKLEEDKIKADKLKKEQLEKEQQEAKEADHTGSSSDDSENEGSKNLDCQVFVKGQVFSDEEEEMAADFPYQCFEGNRSTTRRCIYQG